MKRKGKHPHLAFTDTKIRGTKEPGFYSDGNGLYLKVDRSGAKRWVLRIVVQRRRRDIGLGGVQLVSLREAREKSQWYRKIAREGGDPIAEARKAKIVVPTFGEAATSVHTELIPTWENKKHTDQWIGSLKKYAFPIIGDKPINEISTPDVLNVLSPIWLSKAVTAQRVKERISLVMDWAKAAGFRSGDNPVDGVAKGLPKQPNRKKHHAALPYAEVPTFLSRWWASRNAEIVKLALEFLILTATRTQETLGARWNEIDVENRTWTIPASRMKMKRAHRVPLAPRCVDILRLAKQLSDRCDLVFPGRVVEQPLSDGVFLEAFRRMGLKITAHGMRSSFRDWAAECTNFPDSVCEMALAHAVKDRTEAAYRRGDLFDKRVALMGEWASHCQGDTQP